MNQSDKLPILGSHTAIIVQDVALFIDTRMTSLDAVQICAPLCGGVGGGGYQLGDSSNGSATVGGDRVGLGFGYGVGQ